MAAGNTSLAGNKRRSTVPELDRKATKVLKQAAKRLSPPNMTQFQTRKHCNLPRSNGGLIDERHNHFTSAIVGGITIKCNGQ